ncbi:hypothetical protein UFOVP327_40 [uncultured Caudovirales phage]|uniref:Uncharacterized protein n=1 Tax=uncultured Caudovirales phage TaxID=2100421 RepID=A0A6J5LV04_9CAUD|nr:hypothetical protein UFOVP327_40 [uncultured Caudovirales phage]
MSNMTNYAFVRDGFVIDVIVADQAFIDQLPDTGTGQWLLTDPNTRGGVHYGADGQPDGGVPVRKNFAGIGYIYNSELDEFYPPRPYDTWTLDSATGTWVPPVPYPEDGNLYQWNPSTNNWTPWTYGQ